MSASPGVCSLRAATTASGFLLRIEGRGTMQISPVADQFLSQCFQSQPGCEVTVDLTDCDHLDSTFLGCLVGQHRRSSQAGGALKIFAPPERMKLLTTMKLHQILSIVSEAPTATCALTSLSGEKLAPREQGQHILDCHRRLAELGGSSQAIFQGICDELEKDLSQGK